MTRRPAATISSTDALPLAERAVIVGRERELRRDVHAVVQAAGYTAAELPLTDESIAKIASEGYDVVVWVAGPKDGRPLALLERLREAQSDACVIVVGPDPGAEQVALLLRAGAYDYVTTPLKGSRLHDSLAEGLETRRSFMEVRRLSEKLRESNEALARERDSLQQWNANLVRLNHLTQSMTETLKTDEIVRMIQTRLGEIVPFAVLSLGWAKPERVWVFGSTILEDRTVDSTRRAMLAEVQSLPLSARGNGHASDGGDDRATAAPRAGRLELAVPMLVGLVQVGVMRLERRAGMPFTMHEVELLKIIAGSAALALRNAETHSQVQNLAMTDPLTGLLNRRAFNTNVAREFKESERYGTPLGLIMLDLDHFKAINDRHGHLTGDRLLKEVAGLLTRTVRAMDIVTRYGGEEFAIILRRCELAQAVLLAERIRKRIEEHAFVTNGVRVPLTISLGVVVAPDVQIVTVEDLVAVADRTLYHAKAGGRNRVEVYEPAAAVAAAGAMRGSAHVPGVC